MVLTGDPRLGAHSSVPSLVYVYVCRGAWEPGTYECIYPAVFTQSPPIPPNQRCQTRKVATKMASHFAVNKEISQIIKRAVPEIHEEGDEIPFGSFHR